MVDLFEMSSIKSSLQVPAPAGGSSQRTSLDFTRHSIDAYRRRILHVRQKKKRTFSENVKFISFNGIAKIIVL